MKLTILTVAAALTLSASLAFAQSGNGTTGPSSGTTTGNNAGRPAGTGGTGGTDERPMDGGSIYNGTSNAQSATVGNSTDPQKKIDPRSKPK